MRLSFSSVATLNGSIAAPPDKSLTHRAFMLAAAATSPSVVIGALRGEDCLSTLSCLRAMGLRTEELTSDALRLIPAAEWRSPSEPLDCGNSGTTMRLLSGLIASRPIVATMQGDASLSRRPMGRIAAPLRQMGAGFEGDTPPIRISGGRLTGIEYRTPVASAQIKSCVLLAGLRASGATTVIEKEMSRDHTERFLSALGVDVERREVENGYAATVSGGASWEGFETEIPGDISSAAFWMVAAAMVPQSRVTIRAVGLNPTRSGILDVFRQARIQTSASAARESMGEPVADVIVEHTRPLQPFEIRGDLVPRLIDEIPVLAVLATQCDGVTEIRDAAELRVKESDRIETVAKGLRTMGAQVETFSDGMAITGPTKLKAATIDATGDHRIAMAFAVAALIADGKTNIDGAESIATSYPEFERHLQELTVV